MTKRVCIIIPALNEAARIGALVEGIVALSNTDALYVPLVVDDGSKDGTAQQARQAGAQVAIHETNKGVGAAIRTGIQWALGHDFQYIAHIDGDGQIPADQLPLLVGPVLSGHLDLAIGSRFAAGSPPGLSSWKAAPMMFVSKAVGFLTGYPLSDISCGARCLTRQLAQQVQPKFDYDYIQEVLIRMLASRPRAKTISIHVIYRFQDCSDRMSSSVLKYGIRFLALTLYGLALFFLKRIAFMLRAKDIHPAKTIS